LRVSIFQTPRPDTTCRRPLVGAQQLGRPGALFGQETGVLLIALSVLAPAPPRSGAARTLMSWSFWCGATGMWSQPGYADSDVTGGNRCNAVLGLSLPTCRDGSAAVELHNYSCASAPHSVKAFPASTPQTHTGSCCQTCQSPGAAGNACGSPAPRADLKPRRGPGLGPRLQHA
jgi:hypothetical protein